MRIFSLSLIFILVLGMAGGSSSFSADFEEGSLCSRALTLLKERKWKVIIPTRRAIVRTALVSVALLAVDTTIRTVLSHAEDRKEIRLAREDMPQLRDYLLGDFVYHRIFRDLHFSHSMDDRVGVAVHKLQRKIDRYYYLTATKPLDSEERREAAVALIFEAGATPLGFWESDPSLRIAVIEENDYLFAVYQVIREIQGLTSQGRLIIVPTESKADDELLRDIEENWFTIAMISEFQHGKFNISTFKRLLQAGFWAQTQIYLQYLNTDVSDEVKRAELDRLLVSLYDEVMLTGLTPKKWTHDLCG